MIDLMKGLLPTLGLGRDNRPRMFRRGGRVSAARDKPEAGTAPVRQARGTFDVTCARSEDHAGSRPGQTLLDAADSANGILLESLCRAGICGTCRTRVTQGEVACASDALSAEERAGGLVLACVATAHSNCTIDVGRHAT